MRIVLTSSHDWNPNSVRFPKGSHSKEEEDLSAGIAEIYVDALQSKFHETEIEPGKRDTVHDPYFIVTRLVSQVRIADAKVQDTTRITDLKEDVFEVRRQYVPSQRTFTSKERHSDVNPFNPIKIWQIGLGAATKTPKATTHRMLRSAIMPILRRYMVDRMFERPSIKGGNINRYNGRAVYVP